MNVLLLKKVYPHIVAIILFLLISLSYFSPLLEGKRIRQDDMVNWHGMSKEITDYREATGKEALWTNSMFGGMPAYLITVKYTHNAIRYVNRILNFNLNKPANYLFLWLLGFYILLLAFGVDAWLAIVGAIAFAFSSYFFIISSVGHNTKALAIGYMPPIIAGVVMSYRGKLYLGAVLAALFFSLQLIANHLQITYYTFLIILVFGIYELVYVIREKTYSKFFKTTGVLIIAMGLAVLTNITNILLVYEYGKVSMRGKSELTFDKENKTAGLDKDYATEWSYGKLETLTLLIPNFQGGSSSGSLSAKSETYKVLKNNGVKSARSIIKQLPLYWGDQMFTAGPVYVGAIVFFLFIFGLFVVKGRIKWWLLTATILSILLAWGRNFMPLTDLFLDYFPGYNKFRTVSMILIIAEFTMPLLAILALKKVLLKEIDKKEFYSGLKYSFIIVGGISLIFTLFPGIFDYSSPSDQRYIANGWPQFLIDAIRADRKHLLQSDAFRSLIFIVISASVLLLYYNEKIKKPLFYLAFAFLFLVDLWSIDRRYLNNDNFVSKKVSKTPFRPSQADLEILKDTSLDYRVFNLSNPFNDSRTSYFHKSIGGYHGAKMKRYQELIDFYISKQNMAVINMLNTKYFLVPGKNNQTYVQRNNTALGNTWFVDNYIIVENADSEILALNNFDPAKTVIIDKRFLSFVEGFKPKHDSLSSIKLISYSPNYLVYNTITTSNQLAVFSEIYYNKGWDVFIDGKQSNYFRANYVLRAMIIPSGKHKIEFKFEPKKYAIGEKFSLVSSVILLLLFIIVLFIEVRKDFAAGATH